MKEYVGWGGANLQGHLVLPLCAYSLSSLYAFFLAINSSIYAM